MQLYVLPHLAEVDDGMSLPLDMTLSAASASARLKILSSAAAARTASPSSAAVMSLMLGRSLAP